MEANGSCSAMWQCAAAGNMAECMGVTLQKKYMVGEAVRLWGLCAIMGSMLQAMSAPTVACGGFGHSKEGGV